MQRSTRFGPFVLVCRDGSLWREGVRIPLPPKSFAVLELLVRRAGRLVTKEDLLREVWRDTFVGDAVVKVCVRQIRSALGDPARAPVFVATEPRRGYRFIAAVEASEECELQSSIDLGLTGQVDGLIQAELEAARAAEASQDHAGAADQLAAALNSLRFLRPSDRALACDVAIELGEQAYQAGRTQQGRAAVGDALALARALDDGERMARAALALGQGHASVQDLDPELVKVLEEALGRVKDVGGELVTRLLARLASALTGDPASFKRRRELAKTALARADRERPEQQAWVLRHALWARWGPDDLPWRQRASERLVELSDALGSLESRLFARGLCVRLALDAGDRARALRELESYGRLARTSSRPWFEWSHRRFCVQWALLRGEHEQAEAWISEGLAHAQSFGHPDVLALFYGQRVALRLQQGRSEEVKPFLAASVAQTRSRVAWRCGLVYSLAVTGEQRAAREELRALARRGFEGVPRDSFWTGSMTFLADACAELEERSCARVLYDLLEPHAELCASLHSSVWMGSIHRPLGRLARVLGDADSARCHFARALEVHEQMQATPWILRTRAEAEACAKGRPDEPRGQRLDPPARQGPGPGARFGVAGDHAA